ncbi:MAG: flagellar motor switch protein FliG [Planctomycetaceae bacterium]|nr:flagellar motor switch protein FliG [Planctomycetaceae bacterium]
MTSGLRKAAVLLMSLPQDEAALVLSKLKAKQIEAVSIEIARLETVTGNEQEAVIYEFAEANPNALLGSGGGLDVAKSLVQQALGKDARDTLDTVQQSIEALPFGFLKKVDPQNVVTYINDEHPQTIALILSHLPPAYGAQIIAGLTPERQMSVIQRVAHMGQTNPEVIKQVEEGLESRMVSVMSQQFENAGGVASVAEILNVTDRATERNLLENLAQEDPELVDEIRRLMFVFEDINKLRDKDVQTVLKNVESAQWAMALKGSSEELQQKILGNMSQRASQMLREEMEMRGSVRLSEVEAVQQQIVDIIRRLEDAGEITTHADEDTEEMIQ